MLYNERMLELNRKQIEKLSDLFMDLAKGLFLAAFGVSVLKGIDFLSLLKYLVSGILSVYFSLKLLEVKE